jgi:A/G-specific adenine glycosylase
MDVGATVCRPRAPICFECPLRPKCATQGVLDEPTPRRAQAPFEGSFRQRRGMVLARLRGGPTPIALLDAKALRSLVADGLAALEGETARLP